MKITSRTVLLPAHFSTRANWLCLGTLLIALGLRIWGIDFGLPYLYHPDENSYVTIAQNIFKSGDLNPHFFNYPSLFFYINALAYLPYYVVGNLAGVLHQPADIPPPMMVDMGVGITEMPTTFLLGRGVTVVFGIAAIVLTLVIGWKLTNDEKTGLIAAAMMAVSQTNVGNSRLITPDTFLVFFVLLAFWGATLVFQQGKTRHYIFAGIACGLVASTKHNGAIIVLALVSAHLLRHGLRGLKQRDLYLAFACSILVFVATTPFALLDRDNFWAAVRFEAWHYSTGHAGMEGNAPSWYMDYLLSIEGPVALIGILEIMRGIWVRSKQTLLFSIFPVAYFAFISTFAVRNDRTILPLTPFLFLLGASFLAQWIDRVYAWQPHHITLFAAGVVVGGLLVFSLSQTVTHDLQLSTVDSRQTAIQWINEHLPPQSRVAVEAYSPYVDPKRYSVQGMGWMIFHPPEWYVANGFDYLIFSQGMFGRFYQEPEKYPNEVAEYDNLFDASTW